jgi:integrase
VTGAETVRHKRDAAIVALLLGCGLQRSEVVALNGGDIQRREDHWAIVDVVGRPVAYGRCPYQLR